MGYRGRVYAHEYIDSNKIGSAEAGSSVYGHQQSAVHEVRLGFGPGMLIYSAPERRSIRLDATQHLLARRLQARQGRAGHHASAIRPAVAQARNVARAIRLVLCRPA